jgi:type II secretory pathway component GspD/PulD (secretin)
MLDLQVFQVSHTYMHNIGLHVPDNFNLFNIPVAALAALGGQNIQSLINQLVSGGSINQAGNQSISALIAQLQSQQNSIFSQPLATFGGGLTLMGLSLDQLSAALTMNESSVRQLDHVQLRASQDKEATFKIGERYPVLNASFAPIYNNAAISQVLGNQSYTAPFPSVNYEDIGLTVKAKPTIHSNSDVALELDIEFRTLGSLSADGIPNIFNREYKGGILVKEGEPAVVAGMITQSDQKSLSGLPLFSNVPALGLLTAQHTKQEEDDELLILITPHVVRNPDRPETPEIWMAK